MNSAAVIGRQLRQQQNTGRISGPLVPPQQQKGRPRTPSHIPGLQANRPYSPAPASLTNLGADGDKKFGQYAQHHEFYPHPAHRENAEKDKDAKKKDDEPRLRCTWHCFCVALKALSGGIVLLVLGTIMSIVGFLADNLAVDYKPINGTLQQTIDPDTKAHLHNLTYVGPVIMGLGGIVIVAACVLTFEVRDTLGVKVAPVKPEATATLGATATSSITATSVRKNTLTSVTSDGITKNRSATAAGSLTLPLATISDANFPSKTGRIHETIQETMFSEGEPILGYAPPPQTKSSKDVEGGDRCHQQVSKYRRRYSIADQCITSPSSGTSHLLSPNIETSYFGLPSPQDTEISDPEGCSLVVPNMWRSSRCSCSGSPTHSMSLELYLEENDPPITVAIVEHQENLLLQRHHYQQQQQQQQQQQYQHQQQQRRPKVLASMESDGLSSTASSSSDDIFISQKTHQYCRNYVSVHNPYVDHSSYIDQSDVTTPLLNSSQTLTSSTTITTSPKIDKRFPLLRQGVLGNGSVPPNNR